ncbi:hypothetical protein TNCV_4110711 [Trichonephila clavipes]|nr:hypothetical protein TNCV_4110711 [Trichonephila clavipes]
MEQNYIQNHGTTNMVRCTANGEASITAIPFGSNILPSVMCIEFQAWTTKCYCLLRLMKNHEFAFEIIIGELYGDSMDRGCLTVAFAPWYWSLV